MSALGGYLHGQNWVHRDIKPDNIILRNGDRSEPVLIDFGLGFKDGITADFRTEHGQELGNRFLRLPEPAPNSPLRQDVRTDLAFTGGILFYLLTGLAPATLLDGEGRLPHQRDPAVDRLRARAGARLSRLLGFFDRGFAPKISARFSSATDMRDALQSVVGGSDSASTDDDFSVIRAALQSDANKELGRRKTLFDRAFSEIQRVHQSLLRDFQPTYLSYQSGHVNFVDGLRNTLGFTHFATHDIRFAPEFLISVSGEDLVVTVDGDPLFRTSLDAPEFSDSFRADVRHLYLKGMRKLVERQI